MRLRDLGNGILLCLDESVEPPTGYERSPKDSSIFVRIMPICSFRKLEKVKKSCCGMVTVQFCEKYGKVVSRNACADCGEYG